MNDRYRLVLCQPLVYLLLKPEVIHDEPPADVHHNLPGLCEPQPLVPRYGLRVVLVHREPQLANLQLAAHILHKVHGILAYTATAHALEDVELTELEAGFGQVGHHGHIARGLAVAQYQEVLVAAGDLRGDGMFAL